jgi:uncharacterized protein YcgI (DUF1989 family)
VALGAGDRITVVDLEGRQFGEIAAFSRAGDSDLAALGVAADAKLSFLRVR